MDKNASSRTDEHVQLMEDFEALGLRIALIPEHTRLDEGLELLDDYWEQNRQRDREGWLQRNIAVHKAFLLRQAGRANEALAGYQTWATFGLQTFSEHAELAEGLSWCLSELGRHEEAIAALEEGLVQIPAAAHGEAIWLLREFSRVCAVLGQSVPAEYASRVQSIAAARKMSSVTASGDKPTDLSAAIEAVYQAIYSPGHG